MKASTAILAFAVCCSCMLVSQAFLFNDNNMMLWMMMMNNQNSGNRGGMFSGGMPLMMLASGSDKMKTMGTGLLLSQMFGGQSSASGMGQAARMGGATGGGVNVPMV